MNPKPVEPDDIIIDSVTMKDSVKVKSKSKSHRKHPTNLTPKKKKRK